MDIYVKDNSLYSGNDRNLLQNTRCSSPLLTDIWVYRKAEIVPANHCVGNEQQAQDSFFFDGDELPRKKEEKRMEGQQGNNTKAAETPTDGAASALRSQSPSL